MSRTVTGSKEDAETKVEAKEEGEVGDPLGRCAGGGAADCGMER